MQAQTQPQRRTDPTADVSATRNIRLFRNGANQALRIPREFEFPTNDATMTRVGNKLIIEPARPGLTTLLEAMKDWEPIEEPFPDVDEGLLPLDDIVL